MLAVRISNTCQYKKNFGSTLTRNLQSIPKGGHTLDYHLYSPYENKRSSLYLQQKTRSGVDKQRHNVLLQKFRIQKFFHIYNKNYVKTRVRIQFSQYTKIINKQNTIQSSSTFFQRCAPTPNTRPITRWRKELQVYQEVIQILYIIEYFYTYVQFHTNNLLN